MARAIPDLNLRLAMFAALANAKLIPKPNYKKLRGDEYEYNEALADELGDTPLPDAKLAKLQKLWWTEGSVMFAIWPQFDGETEEFFIEDLRGLEKCTGLRELSIDLGGIGELKSLAPLGALVELRELSIGHAPGDLTPLARLTKLEELSLDGLTATDLSPIAKLPALKKVSLDWRYGEKGPSRKNAQALVDALAARIVETHIEFPCGEVTPAGKKRAKAAANPELEAKILANLDDPKGYLVYADWLQTQGDPLGELITIDHALAKKKSKALVEARRQLLVQHRERLLAGRDREPYFWEWRLGFVRKVTTLSDEDELTALLGSTIGRFLTDLSLHVLGKDGTRLVRKLLAARPRPPLRALELHQDNDRVDASRVGTAFPELVELRLRGGDLRVGQLDFPVLKKAAIYAGFVLMKDHMVESVVKARWPVLEELELSPWTEGLEKALERAPATLRRLRIRGSEPVELVQAVVRSPVLKQLTELELASLDGLDAEAGAALLAAKKSFAHLAVFDFKIGKVDAKQRDALKALQKKPKKNQKG